jgi:hypothetical protein
MNDEGVNTATESRDPFDYIQNGQRDYVWAKNADGSERDHIEQNKIYLELLGADPVTPAEQQRGFAYVGQHNTGGPTGPNANCIGSEWPISEVERLINLPTFDLENEAQRSKLASMGMVLVEMFWKHELLLKNPVFNPVFTVLGDGSGTTTISVWAAFPVPAVEPRIRFPSN